MHYHQMKAKTISVASNWKNQEGWNTLSNWVCGRLSIFYPEPSNDMLITCVAFFRHPTKVITLTDMGLDMGHFSRVMAARYQQTL